MAVASESLENFMLSFSLSMEGALRNWKNDGLGCEF
jgi:hypothetical protein